MIKNNFFIKWDKNTNLKINKQKFYFHFKFLYLLFRILFSFFNSKLWAKSSVPWKKTKINCLIRKKKVSYTKVLCQEILCQKKAVPGFFEEKAVPSHEFSVPVLDSDHWALISDHFICESRCIFVKYASSSVLIPYHFIFCSPRLPWSLLTELDHWLHRWWIPQCLLILVKVCSSSLVRIGFHSCFSCHIILSCLFLALAAGMGLNW